MFSATPRVRLFARITTPAVVALLCMATSSRADIKTYTVSARAGQGTHTSIQSAINSCSTNDVCTISLVDSLYTLSQAIWIEGKSNLSIVSGRTTSKPILQYQAALLLSGNNPNAVRGGGTPPTKVARLFTQAFIDPVTGVADPNRPAGWLMWPYKATTSTTAPLATPLPGDKSDTSTGYSSSGFQYNGMIVIRKSTDVTISGLKLQSTPTTFQNPGVWSQKYDVLFGNVGINLMQSLRAKVQDCDITGFFSAFYIQGRNVGGAFGRPNADDLDDAQIVPLSRYGQVGDHMIERNFVFNNWWFAYNEIDWDLGSTIRYNVSFQNMNKSFQYGDTLTNPLASSDEANNMTGGFMYAKDAVVIPHRIYNNTLLSSPIVMGHGYWRTNVQSQFYNNVVSFYKLKGKQDTLGPTDQHNLLGWYGEMAWSNTIQLMPGMKSVAKKQSGSWPIKDTAVHIQYSGSATYQTCGGGCYVNGVNLLDPYISELQPNSLFNTWGIAKGTYVRIAGDSVDWTKVASNATITGYEGKIYSVWEENGYGLWGLFDKLPGIDTTSAKLRKNYWAITIPTQGKVDSTTTKVSSVMDLAPKWGDNVVSATIRNKAWFNTDLGGPDGSVSDRGAFQYDSVSKRTILGGIRNGVQLDVVDQRIVTMKGTSVQIPFIVEQVSGSTVVPSYYSDIRVDSVAYYKEFPFSDTAEKDATMENFPPAQMVRSVQLSGDTLKFTVPAAVTYDYARFVVFVSAQDPVSGQRVRTVANYVYRKAAYRLAVDFCSDGTSAATCASSLVKSTRVGEKVFIRVRVINTTSDAEVSTMTVTSLVATPGSGDKIINAVTGNAIDTGVFSPSFTGTLISPVQFLTVGQNDITTAGVSGKMGIMGAGAIMVKAGPPYRVQWVDPASTSVVPCIPNAASPYLLDTATFCGDELPPSGLTAADLRVYDRYGNQVTEAAAIKVSASNQINPLLAAISAQGTAKVSATVVGPASDSVVVTSDTTGKAKVWITGAPSLAGVYPFGWVQFLARVDSVHLPSDTARARLGKPAMHLIWANPIPIDTTIRTSVPVRLVATLDTTPDASGAYASATVRVWPTISRTIVFYKDAARTLPVTDSMVTLSKGEITLWVASDVATPVNDLKAQLIGLPGIPTYKNVQFYVPPPPPSPVPDAAVFLDRNCDGKADVARLWLKGNALVAAALDTTKVKPELFLIAFADGTTDTIGATEWSAVDGDFSVLDLKLTNAPATTAPAGVLAMTVRLRRFPADDSVLVVGTVIPVLDRVSPRPTAGAIIENFSPGTVDDTVRVTFSEPVSFAGTAWPFQTRELPAGTIVNTTGISVKPMSAATGTSLTFVIAGNAAGTIHAGQSIAIDSAALLVDGLGNHGKASECLGDTAVLALVPQPVPMVASWMKDVDGDGAADRLAVVFKRALRNVDVPDSFVVAWGGVTRVVSLSTATTSDSASWMIQLVTPFPKGITSGGGVAGEGQLTLLDGAGVSARVDKIAVVDSVSPIPTKAELHYGAVGGNDTLFVTYSEAMKTGTATSWMLDQRLSDAAISVVSGAAVGTDGLKYAFIVDPSAANYPRPGDSIRLPAGVNSRLLDANGILPSSPVSPYVVVTAMPIPMVRSALHDSNGDGAAEQVTVQFLRKLRVSDIPDSLVLTWAGSNRKATFATATTSDSSVWTLVVAPFAKGVTAGGAADGSGITVSFSGSGLSKQSVQVALADSVAPIPMSANLRYGNAGASDTLVVVYSEPLVKRTGASWMLDQQAGDAAVGIASGAASGGDSVWRFVIDPAATVYPHPDDSIRLPSGTASNFADARGILPTSPTPYVVVHGPPIPMIGAFLRDTDGDGSADQATVSFLKPLRSSDKPDSLTLKWGDESRTALFGTALKVGSDSSVWTLSVAPFIKGATIGGGANGAGTVTLRKDVVGVASRSETIALADSVAPIPVSAELRYGAAGASDSLIVRYSEPVASRTGSEWMLNQKGGDVSVGATSGAPSADNRVWTLLVPAASGTVHPGDSVRLPSGVASNLKDAQGVLPTSPKSPYVKVLGGDRPPMSAWYLDGNGDGQVDSVVLVFAEALMTNPSYVLQWGAESRVADSASYGGKAINKTRLEIKLASPFAYGVTRSDSAYSFGVQTSVMVGAAPAISTFPVRDSVPPVILTARVGYTDYNESGEMDSLFLKLSEPVTISGTTLVLGRGKDGNAYPIGEGHETAKILQVSGDSLVFLCDTTCVDELAAAGMPGNGDSVRLTMPRTGVSVRDLAGNAPGVVAKWTLVRAGDRPYVYNVNIFPQGVLVEDDGFVPNQQIKSKDPLSVWILKDGRWWAFKNGQRTGESYPAGKGGEIERNGVGLKLDVNGACDVTLILYDLIGTYIYSTEVKIDSAMAKELGNNAGKYSVLYYVNGRYLSPDKKLASGVYLVRYLPFRDELQSNGTRLRKVIDNRIYKLGIKGEGK